MRTRTRPRGLHQIALVALFTLGNTLLRFPWANAQAGITVSFVLSEITAMIFGLCASFGAAWLYRKWLRSKKRLRLAVCIFFSVSVCALAFCFAVSTSRDLLLFMERSLLPEGTGLVFAALFLAVCAWLSRAERRGMDIFALIAFFSALVAVAVLFLLGIPQFRVEYGNVELPGVAAIGASLLPIFVEFALPMIPLGVYLALAKPQNGGKRPWQPLVCGVLFGGGIMLFCVLQTLLTFGASYAAGLAYPYSTAVRVVSLGAYAFRPELFSYVADFLSCLVRVAVCFSCLKFAVGRFLPRVRNWIPPFAALFGFITLCFF